MSKHSTTYAGHEDVADFAAGLKQQYLLCRTYGHSFSPFTVSSGRTKGRKGVYFEQVLRCKCRTMRRLLMTETGSVVSSSYDYSEAPGYLTQGMGRIVGTARDRLRLESVTRLISRSS